jgi:hypothetical protein
MTDRTRARVLGVLFIVASAAAILGGTLVLPAEDAGTLASIAADQASIVSGVLLELLMVMAVVGIAALFLPVLRRTDEGLAVGYVGARILEGVLLLAATASALVVAALGQADGAVMVEVDLLRAVRESTYLLGSLVALGAGALVLYSLLWRSRVVPPWLSGWGLAGAVLVLARGVVEVYGVELSGAVQGALAAPIGLNEMVLAVWLIVKGFDTRVLVLPETEPAATASLTGS